MVLQFKTIWVLEILSLQLNVPWALRENPGSGSITQLGDLKEVK